MKEGQVNFDFPGVGEAVEAFVRAKAIETGTTIVYRENGKIIEEDPRTGVKTVIEESEKQ
jgi:hypothetical protein